MQDKLDLMWRQQGNVDIEFIQAKLSRRKRQRQD